MIYCDQPDWINKETICAKRNKDIRTLSFGHIRISSLHIGSYLDLGGGGGFIKDMKIWEGKKKRGKKEERETEGILLPCYYSLTSSLFLS